MDSNFKAVMSGDLVHSRRISADKKEILNSYMKKAFEFYGIRLNINSKENNHQLEFFRGDSFQAVLDKPEYAFRMAILLRARLRNLTRIKDKNEVLGDFENLPKKYEKQISPAKLWDARIAIGIGTISHQAKTVSESDGTAFLLSGHLLDQFKKDELLGIKIENHETVFEQMMLFCRLTNLIVQKWTIAQAAVAAEYLMYPQKKTQVELQDLLKIEQSILSRRLSSGHIGEVARVCSYFEILIPKLLC